MIKNTIITPEYYKEHLSSGEWTPIKGRLLFVGCNSGTYLARQVKEKYEEMLLEKNSNYKIPIIEKVTRVFKDGELCPRFEENVRGTDAFVFQAVYDPTENLSVNDNYLELFITVRALKENGANQVTAIIPYLAYGKQDKPTKYEREATSAKLMADLIQVAGADNIIIWDPHVSQVKGFYKKVTLINSATFFIDSFEEFKGRADVILVAPDAGAAKNVVDIANALGLTLAVVNKERPKPGEAAVLNVVGDFRNKTTAIIIDDMITSAGTIYHAIKSLHEKTNIREFHVGVSHMILVDNALGLLGECHKNLGLKQIIFTDSVPQNKAVRAIPYFRERSLAKPLALTINHLHYFDTISDIYYKPNGKK